MIVKIRAPDGNGTAEWVIVELQGKIQAPPGETLDGQYLGHINMDASGKILLTLVSVSNAHYFCRENNLS